MTSRPLLLILILAIVAPARGDVLQSYSDPVLQRQALSLARAALQAWVQRRTLHLPPDLHPDLGRPAGVFVSLENRRHEVRGCRGTLQARTASLAQEIVANVREACELDPLHRPIQPAEVNDVRIILCIPGRQDTAWPGEVWDAHRYGVLVESGPRAAVMLPWEAPDSEHQVAWGRKRARLGPTEPCRMVRFEAVRFAEAWPPPVAVPQPESSPPPAYW